MTKFCQLILVVLFMFRADGAVAQQMCEQEMSTASAKHNVPIAVLYAVALTESGKGGRLNPFALNIDGVSIIETTEKAARVKFDNARAGGARFIDVGCMQVNHHFHGHEFASIDAMFNPRLNVDYGARFLRRLKEQEGTWTRAVGRYNAGQGNAVAQKKYVCRVIAALASSGFGQWTAEARRFCMGG